MAKKKSSHKNRPSGITILSILWALGGAFYTLAGVVLVMSTMISTYAYTGGGEAIGFILGFGVGFAIIMFILAALSFFISFALWNMKEWSRIVAMIFAVLQLFAFPVGTVISIIVLWYLTRPEVKRAFH